MRLHWKLMLTYTSVIVLVVASVHLYLDRAMRAFLVGQLGDTLTREVRLAGAYLRRDLSDRPPPETLDGLADLLGQRLGVRATVTDGTGRVLGDSEVRLEDLAGLENHADRPEVREAWSGRMGRSLRYSATLKQEMLYVAEVVPGVGDGRVVMRLAMPVRDVGQIQKRIHDAIWAASVLALALALALAYGGSRFVSRPIVDMTQVARAVASGDFTGETQAPGVSVRELRDLAGALDGMRRQIQERIGQITVEKSRLEAVLDSIAEGMLVTDRDGHVQMINRAFERLFGTTGPAEGRMPVELVRSGEVQEAIERTLATGRATTQGMTLPGVPEWHLDVHVAPILQEDACIGSVTVFYDITELLRLERVRKDFVANVSHELRTPLTAIKGCAETLVERALADRAVAERFVQTILSHSDRLQHLLDDLLDLSRLESGKLELAPEVCPIRRVVQTGVGSVVQSAEEKEIAINLDVPEEVEVRCDPKLIEQTLINLLDNAVKYTPNGGSVWVVVRSFVGTDSGSELSIPSVSPEAGERPAPDGEGAEARIVLEVTDTGIGISSDALPRVFERFYRVDKGRSRAMGGTGLGLSIVRHIVEAHGERVYARSELGKGSTFGFTLPVVV